ncbi:hypothetical protein RND81_12G202100 [Saponaria officinalis]|uniref:Uncharacterized protein n=1 Tax=Saponaria officinalis TaxID=3572 RepID=A0AAW1HD31_SAPOF
MAATNTQVVIPFHPLMVQITESLNFPEPVYQCLDVATNNACVAVKTECAFVSYISVGGEAGSIEESCEKAAQKVVRDLMKKYNVCVKDVTSAKRKTLRRCAALYQLKHIELDRVEKRASKIPLLEEVAANSCNALKKVTVDFMSVLRAIFRKVEIHSTPIETVEHAPNEFTSWFTVTTPNKVGFECIFSDCCQSLVASKQNLAQKVIPYIMSINNLDIVDANYNPNDYRLDVVRCALNRESYLTIKERVLGLREEVQPSILLVEQDCRTPRGSMFQVPSMTSPPLPPKKRKFKQSISHASVVAASEVKTPIYLSPVPELEYVFKRLKFA